MSNLSPILLHDYTRYNTNHETHNGKHISKEELEFLQQLQEELQEEDCIFLASSPKEEEEGKPQVIKTLGTDTIETQGYVGSLVFQGRTVTIHSRFDDSFFLRYLLENSWEVSMLVSSAPEGPASSEQDNIYLWRLVCQLAVQLQTAWKKGTFRTYRTFSHFDSRVRGQIDISRHIRLSMGLDDGRVAYRTHEYSPDNPYNRLILCAMATAQQRFPEPMRRLLRQLPECKVAVQLLHQQIPDAEQDQPRALLERTRWKITHPIYRSYEAVRLTARAVLRQMGLGLQGQARTVGILLNIEQLWEEFLAKTLFQNVTESDRQSSQDILERHMTIRPDFYIFSQHVVLDAKYRPVWGETLVKREEKWSEYVRDDVYQILSYMLALDCHDGGVIFPIRRSQLKEPKVDFLLPSSIPVSAKANGRNFWRIPFVIPDNSETYEEFQDSIRKQAKQIRAYPPDKV